MAARTHGQKAVAVALGALLAVSVVSCQSLESILMQSRPQQADVVMGPPRATIASPADERVPEWRIGYRVYLNYDELSVPAERWDELVDEVQLFADDVYHFSGEGLRVSVDIFDMGATSYPGNGDTEELEAIGLPGDAARFRSAGGYHSVFFTFPWNGPPYQGAAEQSESNLTVVFPMGRTEDGTWSLPWELLLIHEFLHLIVYHYSAVDWPAPDVHGAAEHGYASRNPMVDDKYFADLMQGKVMERRRAKGIRPDQYADYGLPRL